MERCNAEFEVVQHCVSPVVVGNFDVDDRSRSSIIAPMDVKSPRNLLVVRVNVLASKICLQI